MPAILASPEASGQLEAPSSPSSLKTSGSTSSDVIQNHATQDASLTDEDEEEEDEETLQLQLKSIQLKLAAKRKRKLQKLLDQKLSISNKLENDEILETPQKDKVSSNNQLLSPSPSSSLSCVHETPAAHGKHDDNDDSVKSPIPVQDKKSVARKLFSEASAKRRRIDATGHAATAPAPVPHVAKKLLSASILQTPPSLVTVTQGKVASRSSSAAAAAAAAALLVAKSPSPAKPKRSPSNNDAAEGIPARIKFGLDKGEASDINLSRKKHVTAKTKIIMTDHGNSAMQAPSMALKSTRQAQSFKNKKDSTEKLRGTVYDGIVVNKEQKRVEKELEASKSSFAEKFMSINSSKDNTVYSQGNEKVKTEKTQIEGRIKQFANIKAPAPDNENPESSSENGLELLKPTVNRKLTYSEIVCNDADESELEIDSGPSNSSIVPDISSQGKQSQRPRSLTDEIQKYHGINKDLYDPYSDLDLLVRYTSKEEVEQQMDEKKTYTISTLCSKIHPPEYDPPAYANWVVFGVVAKKTGIKYTKDRGSGTDDGPRSNKPEDVKKTIERVTTASLDDRNCRLGGKSRKDDNESDKTGKLSDQEALRNRRYFAITFTDFRTEVSLFIMGKAFDKFWKLQVGQVIGVLNPGLHKAKSDGVASKIGFGLNITEPDDVILEIGKAKDLGICKSLTKTDNQCSNWVNLKRTQYCEYHVERAVRRTSNRRAEVNKGTVMFSPKKNGKRLIVNREGNGLLPDTLGPKFDRHVGNGGGKIYASKAFFREDDMFEKPNPKFRR
ncbi:hypothetical protein V1514DRAFT_352494 [Lipomyces japonicus]|uniref:uncharacterized protein n=1 Tax=Lipomyces japonicus TaxID=56871 RepID=UPI0034CD943B